MVAVIILLSLLLVVCAIGWMSSKIGMLTILACIEKRGHPLPTNAEIDECSKYVMKNIAKDITKKIKIR